MMAFLYQRSSIMLRQPASVRPDVCNGRVNKRRGLCGFPLVVPAFAGTTVLSMSSTLPLDLRLQGVLDDAVKGRGFWRRPVALLGDEFVALRHQGCEFLVQRIALLHLLVEFLAARRGLQRA